MLVSPLEDECEREASSPKGPESAVGVLGSSFTQTVSEVKEVQRLDGLLRAHVLLSVMADRAAPECRLNLLRAYAFVLRIWQVRTGRGFGFPAEGKSFSAVPLMLSRSDGASGVHGDVPPNLRGDDQEPVLAASLSQEGQRKSPERERCKSALEVKHSGDREQEICCPSN